MIYVGLFFIGIFVLWIRNQTKSGPKRFQKRMKKVVYRQPTEAEIIADAVYGATQNAVISNHLMNQNQPNNTMEMMMRSNQASQGNEWK